MTSIPGRSLGGISGQIHSYSREEQRIQQILAVTSASISLLFSFISFYWFAKMKRNFRHQYVSRTQTIKIQNSRSLIMPRLIMLLIASGMFKALWYLIPPITILAGLDPISYGFCQAAGFLLAVGIEASGPL